MESSTNSTFSQRFCHCGVQAPMKMSWTAENPGRLFYGCRNYRVNPCEFFVWVGNKSTVERMREFYIKIQELKGENEELQTINMRLQQKNQQLKLQNEVWEKKYKNIVKKLKYLVLY